MSKFEATQARSAQEVQDRAIVDRLAKLESRLASLLILQPNPDEPSIPVGEAQADSDRKGVEDRLIELEDWQERVDRHLTSIADRAESEVAESQADLAEKLSHLTTLVVKHADRLFDLEEKVEARERLSETPEVPPEPKYLVWALSPEGWFHTKDGGASPNIDGAKRWTKEELSERGVNTCEHWVVIPVSALERSTQLRSAEEVNQRWKDKRRGIPEEQFEAWEKDALRPFTPASEVGEFVHNIHDQQDG